jgi:hypothetical protein
VPPGFYTSPKPDDIKRASSTFKTTSCSVKTDGARVEVAFNGLSMGIFFGTLQFTAYRGTNLLRMDAIAKTDEPSVAYKYDAASPAVIDACLPGVGESRPCRVYQFGGLKNQQPVIVKAENRVSMPKAAFAGGVPMPHAPSAAPVEVNPLLVPQGQRIASRGIRQSEQEVPEQATTWSLQRAPARCSTWVYLAASAQPRPPAGGAGIHAQRT